MEEEITRLAAATLSSSEAMLYTNTNGAIIKTIMLYNSNTTEKEITLYIDGVIFLFKLNAQETKIIDSPLVVNTLKAIGEAVNIHVSGIQLGGA